MTNPCAAVRSRFEPYRDESLARDERMAMRDHLASCADCRSEAARFDPVLLFAAMPEETVSAAEAGQILAAVRSGIALKTAEKRLASASGSGSRSLSSVLSPGRRISATAAAVAAAVVLAWTAGPGAALRVTPVLPASPPSAAAPSSASLSGSGSSIVPAARASASDPVDGGSMTVPSALARPEAAAGSSDLPFGEASGPAKGNLPADATIYDWNPGGGQPRVVWIVDRSLDI